MPHPPRTIQLTGGDYFIHAVDRQMRQAGLPGNICRLVMRLKGGMDLERLRRVARQSPALWLIANTRMTRLVPVLSPKWRLDRNLDPNHGGVPLEEHDGTRLGAMDDEFFAHGLARPMRSDRTPNLALDLILYPDHDTRLILTWHHALMDVRGAELLLAHLERLGAGQAESPGFELVDRAQLSFSFLKLWRGYPAKVGFARKSLFYITDTCQAPIASLVSASTGPARSANRSSVNHFHVIRFSGEETRQIDGHCERLNASFRRSLFYLAASAQAVDAILRRRGGSGMGAYVVPVPHDLRKRGAAGPIFSNQLSFLFFRIEPEQTGDLAGMVSVLSRQMMDQIRGRLPESFIAAMELFKPTPLGFYISQLKRPTKGRIASFYFSDAGESCAGLGQFMGARIEDVTHFAPATCPPGLTIIFSRCRGRLSAVLSWVDGCLEPAERDLFAQSLHAALRGDGAQ